MSAAIAALGDLLPNWAPGVSLEQAGISAIDETLHHQINVSGRAQLVVQAILFAIISIIYTSLMFVRLYRHLNGGERIWFFRRLSRQDNAGVYIVPMLVGYAQVILTVVNIRAFGHELGSQKSIRTLQGLISIFANLAGWFQVFSMFLVAVQTRESYSSNSAGKASKNSLPPAFIFNLLQFGVPALFTPVMLGILCKVSISWITLYEAFGRLRATLVSLLGSEVISPVALIKGLVQIDTAMTDLKNYWVFQQGLFGAAVLWTLLLVTFYLPTAIWLLFVSHRALQPKWEIFKPKSFQLRHSLTSLETEKTLHSPTSSSQTPPWEKRPALKINRPSKQQFRLLFFQLIAFILFMTCVLVTEAAALAFTFYVTFLDPERVQDTLLVTNWVQAIFGLAVAYIFLLRTLSTPKKVQRDETLPTSMTEEVEGTYQNESNQSIHKLKLRKVMSWASFRNREESDNRLEDHRRKRGSESTLSIKTPSRDNEYYKAYTKNITNHPNSPYYRSQSVSFPLTTPYVATNKDFQRDLHQRTKSYDSHYSNGLMIELGVHEFMADDEFRWEGAPVSSYTPHHPMSKE